METTVLTLTTHLANIGSVLDSAAGWVTTCTGMITGSPLLYVPCIMGVGLVGINIIKRFV